MRDFTDNCIVLKIADHRDDDRIATTLTAEHGMVTLLLRGVKNPKAKLKPFAQMFSAFNSHLVSGRGAYLTPTDPMPIADGFALCADLRIYTAASVAAEATVAALGDGEPHPDVFVALLKLLKALEFDGDPYYQASVYMCELLRLSGFYRNYTYSDSPLTPVQMLGYAQAHGHEKHGEASDLSRRALKYACAEFERNFDTGLKSSESIDLYK